MRLAAKRFMRFMVLGAAVAAMALAHSAAESGKQLDPAAAFERLKDLAGEWEATTSKGKRARTRYEVVSGGSAVIERYTDEGMPPGSDMITAFHLDGKRLLLTHYCVANNQPRMSAQGFDPGKNELRFEFLDATNLADGDSGHMRRAIYRFEDADHFYTQWEFFQGGKPAFTESLRYTRAAR